MKGPRALDTTSDDTGTKCCAVETQIQGTTSNDAGTKGCGEGPSSGATTSCAYTCWVDGRPCEVVQLFAPALRQQLSGSDDEVGAKFRERVEPVSHCLPCSRCRAMEANAQKLPRLGCHERRILLQAPSPDGESKVIEPPAPGRSADEANRRAIRKLYHAGLLYIGRRNVKVETKAEVWIYRRGYVNLERDYWKRAVWLSPLGQAVVDRLRAALESGKPIRWAPHREALVSSCRRQSQELLSEFLEKVRK